MARNRRFLESGQTMQNALLPGSTDIESRLLPIRVCSWDFPGLPKFLTGFSRDEKISRDFPGNSRELTGIDGNSWEIADFCISREVNILKLLFTLLYIIFGYLL